MRVRHACVSPLRFPREDVDDLHLLLQQQVELLVRRQDGHRRVVRADRTMVALRGVLRRREVIYSDAYLHSVRCRVLECELVADAVRQVADGQPAPDDDQVLEEAAAGRDTRRAGAQTTVQANDQTHGDDQARGSAGRTESKGQS